MTLVAPLIENSKEKLKLIYKMQKSKIGVGLSLGRNNSSIQAIDDNEVSIVHKFKLPNSAPFKPSAFLQRNQNNNQEEDLLTPKIFHSLSFLGKQYGSDPEVQKKAKSLTDIFLPGNELQILIENKKFSPEDVLKKIVTNIKKYIDLDDKIAVNAPKVVLTFPVSFERPQQQILEKLSKDSGLEILGILDEHTAAACNHLIPDSEKHPILYFDLSQRTFHVSVLSHLNSLNPQSAKRVTKGGPGNFGGESFSVALFDFCVQQLKIKRRIDLLKEQKNPILKRNQDQDLAQLRKECQSAVIKLSSSDSAPISIQGREQLEVTIGDFETVNEENFQRCLAVVEQVLKDCSLSKKDVHHVVLDGKSCQMPRIQEMLREYFGSGIQLHFKPKMDSAASFAAVYALSGSFPTTTSFSRANSINKQVKEQSQEVIPQPVTPQQSNHFRTERVPLLVDTLKRMDLNKGRKPVQEVKPVAKLRSTPRLKQQEPIQEEASMEISEGPTEVEQFEKLLSNDTSRQTILIEVAHAIYKENMDKVMATPDPIEENTLHEHHELSIQLALRTLSKVLPLTQQIMSTVKEQLEEIYKEYSGINDQKAGSNGPAIGIDLGTTYCYAAYYNRETNAVKMIPNDMGKNATPSYVLFSSEDDSEEIVGEAAKTEALTNFENVVFDVKRVIGRSIDDKKVMALQKYWPFRLIQDDRRIKIGVGKNKVLLPEEIMAKLLTYLKHCAEEHFGENIINAVVTVPAYFNDRQRSLTKEACKMAGLNILQLLNEPTAAALAYGLHEQDRVSSSTPPSPRGRHSLIFDLGGGTFDLAILQTKNKQINIKAIDGDPYLGGEDFDNAMVTYLLEECKRKHGKDISKEDTPDKISRRLRRIKMQCEVQKCLLSAHNCRRVVISLDAILPNVDLSVPITRQLFESLIEDKVQICMGVVERALKKAGLSHDDISDVVLVGGSSRIPRISEVLSERFPKSTIVRTINPDEAVASGAAVLASFVENPELPNISIQECENTVFV